MSVEVYSLVEIRLPMSERQKKDVREYRKSVRKVRESGLPAYAEGIEDVCAKLSETEIEYHFAHLKLVQGPGGGKTIPVPKWEIVKTHFTIDEDEYPGADYTDITSKKFTPEQFAKLGEINDPYRDCFCSYADEGCSRWISQRELKGAKTVYVPDYLKEWGNFFYDHDFDEESLPPLPCLPLRYPIDVDRKIQLRQIRFLFPETKVMPLFAALDYVRDQL